MSDYHDHIPDDALERYLDGTLHGEELAAFEVRLANEPELRSAVEDDRRLEASLRDCFQPSALSSHQLDQAIAAASDASVARNDVARRSKTKRRVIIACISALAAVAAWIAVIANFSRGRGVEAYFVQRPLVSLYQETVEKGFRPYYFCEDQERFASTFRKRQDVAIVLTELPEDRRMVGLSYLGGLSRNTTAMLAYVEEQPVVVFVDRSDLDNQVIATQLSGDSDDLNVHRSELGDLVVYEVSPFTAPKMGPYLEVVQ